MELGSIFWQRVAQGLNLVRSGRGRSGGFLFALAFKVGAEVAHHVLVFAAEIGGFEEVIDLERLVVAVAVGQGEGVFDIVVEVILGVDDGDELGEEGDVLGEFGEVEVGGEDAGKLLGVLAGLLDEGQPAVGRLVDVYL